MDQFKISDWQNGFLPANIPTLVTKGHRRFRGYQKKAIKALIEPDHAVLVAPTGSGKSLMIAADIHHCLTEQDASRAVITVPQRVISAGFGTKEPLQFYNLAGKKCEFFVTTDLCQGSTATGKIDKFIHWLKEPAALDNNRIILTSVTFVAAFKRLKDLGELDCFDNFVWWNDETHHEANDSETTNQLAVISNYLLDNKRMVAQRKATATYYRNDKAAIVDARHQDKFQTIRVSIEDYLKESSIRGIEVNIGICDSFDEGVKALYSEELLKTLIFLPPVNSTQYDKFDLRDRLSSAIVKINPTETFLDFVDPANQKNSLEILDTGDDADIADTFFCQEMLKEGANWTCAERAIVLGNRKSLLSMHQILGRLLRSTSYPKTAKLYILLERGFNQISEEKVIEKINNYLKHLMLLMIGIDNFLPNANLSINKKKAAGRTANIHRSYLDEIFDCNDIDQADFEFSVMRDSWQYDDPQEVKKHFEQIVSDNLQKFGIDADIQRLASEIWVRNKKRNAFLTQNITAAIDVNLIDEVHPYQWGKMFVAKLAGPKWFERLRRASGKWKSFAEAKIFVQSLNLKSKIEWDTFANSTDFPNDLPKIPNAAYRSEWTNWSDFLGNGKIPRNREIVSYNESKSIVQKMKFTSRAHYVRYDLELKAQLRLPSCPELTYSDEGWEGYDEWLGLRKKVTPIAYEQAQKIVAGWTKEKYYSEYKQHPGLPSRPHVIYSDSWDGWPSFFGRPKVEFLSYTDCQRLVRKLKIQSGNQYAEYWRAGKLSGCPFAPDRHFKGSEWKNWGVFLNTGAIAHYKKNYRDFTSARSYASLNFRTSTEFKNACKNNEVPDDIPTNPNRTYASEWVSWSHFLGMK